MKKNTKRIIQISTLSSILILFTILLVIALRSSGSTRRGTDIAIDKLSSFYIQELAKNSTSLITEELVKNRTYIDNALSVISQEDLSSVKAFRGYLGKIRRLYGIDTFALVDEAAAETGGDGEEEHRIKAPASAGERLGEAGHVGIVVEVGVESRGLGEVAHDLEVVPAHEVGRVEHLAATQVERAGASDTDAGELVARLLLCSNPVHERGAVVLGATGSLVGGLVHLDDAVVLVQDCDAQLRAADVDTDDKCVFAMV